MRVSLLRSCLVLSVLVLGLFLSACPNNTTAPPICSADSDCPASQSCQSGVCGCGEGQTLCGETCVSLLDNTSHCGSCGRACSKEESCVKGQCLCPSGKSPCGGSCVDTASDPKHCGSCGQTCQDGERCVGGSCFSECPTGTDLCGTTCVDTTTSPSHCGACGTACASGQSCVKGQCVCAEGLRECSGSCVDPRRDPKHCGTCDQACAKGLFCNNGRCGAACNKATPTECFGGCSDLNTDSKNCGACGNACSDGKICQGGKCACPPSLADCVGTCIDTKISRLHCGACNNNCPQGQICANGKCVVNCPNPTETNCFGGCIDTQKDTNHCGSCGNKCAAGQLCVKGKCECPTGRKLCDGVCVEAQNDPLHCGVCNKACPSGELCAAGQCVKSCPQQTPTPCVGSCVNTKSDVANCGSCNNKCLGGKSCFNGRCGCPAGTLDCGGLCVNSKQDVQHCGACNTRCPQGQLCRAGKCERNCGSLSNCGNTCSNLKSDDANCGACGNSCPAGQRCLDGVCACPNSTTLCQGSCVDTQRDAKHCGACGKVCKSGETCTQGACVDRCGDPKLKFCSGGCVNLETNTRHCGACGQACGSGASCNNGSCSCPKGQEDCSGACVDKQSDAKNCGACGKACAQDEYCFQGACRRCTPAAPVQCGSTCCNQGQVCCSGACVDLFKDKTHCGGCGLACATGQSCCRGACQKIEPETCDGKDNDCNGLVDDGVQRDCYTGPNNTEGKGLCKKGQQLCVNGTWTACIGEVKPTSEICNNIDDDCNGQIDDNVSFQCYTGPKNTLGVGSCAGGKQTCTAGQWSNCVGEVLPQLEDCNGKDDDCDGQVDEVSSRKCYSGAKGTENVGVCKGGTQTCTAGKWSACAGEVVPSTEVCDGLDNDCDGKYFPGCTWVAWLRGPKGDAIEGIATDSKGNVYSTGYAAGYTIGLGKTFYSTPGSIFVNKFDSTGKLVWNSVAGDRTYKAARDIAVDSKGNVFVAAYVYSWSTGLGDAKLGTNVNMGNIRGRRAFVAMLDDKGDWKWSFVVGSNRGSNFGYRVKADSKGNSYFMGSFQFTATIGTTTHTALGGNDTFVVKLDPTGKLLWTKTFGSKSNVLPGGMTLDAQDNLYVSGQFQGTLTFESNTFTGPTATGVVDAFVAKIDPTGKTLWARQVKQTNPTRLAVDAQENLYITATFNATGPIFGTTTLTSAGGTDAFVAKYDKTGKHLWFHHFSNKQNITLNGLGLDSKGNVNVAGQFRDSIVFGTNTTISTTQNFPSDTDIFVAKYDSAGKFLHVIRGGSAEADFVQDLAIGPNDERFLGGYFTAKTKYQRLDLSGFANDGFIWKPTPAPIPGFKNSVVPTP